MQYETLDFVFGSFNYGHVHRKKIRKGQNGMLRLGNSITKKAVAKFISIKAQKKGMKVNTIINKLF